MTAPILPAAFSRPASPDLAPDGSRPLTGFVAGTRIATPTGYVAVERLAAGDLVLTADGRHVRIHGVGIRDVAMGIAQTAPVLFSMGPMDNMRPLRLAQGQGLRLTGWRAQMFFEAEAVLVPAAAFVDGTTVVIETQPDPLRYINLIFASHEVILAENIACAALCFQAYDPAYKGQITDDAATLPQTVGAPDLPVVSFEEARMVLAA